jgi:hypothetical protein
MKKSKPETGDEYNARIEAEIAKLPPAERAQYEEALEELSKVGAKFADYVRDLLSRVDSKGKPSPLKLRAAAHFHGRFSDDEIGKLPLSRIFAELELKAAEIERTERMLRGPSPAPSQRIPKKKLSSIKARAAGRCEWLDTMLADKGWTSDLEIKDHGGPAYNTIRKYRSAKPTAQIRYVRHKLATAFGLKEISEVPE